MKKQLLFLFLGILLLMVGCDDQSSLANDTTNDQLTTELTTLELTTEMTDTEEHTTVESTSESIITTMEPTTSNDILTTDAEITTVNVTEITIDYETFVDEVFQQLSEEFPSQISEDYILPSLDIENLTIEYYFDRNMLVDRTINYQASAQAQTLDFFVLINYFDFSKSYAFSVIQLRDDDLYEEAVLNLKFDNAFNEIISQIPSVIYSDLTLPILDSTDVEVSYSVDHSYIFNHRLVFTYPESQAEVLLTVSIEYEDENRSLILAIKMSAYDDLPKIPQVHITTDNEAAIESKEEYVNGRLSLYEYDDFNQEHVLLNDVLMKIRLRGNSTMFMPKKPYKIKFENKQYVFGDYKEKDWVLLANFADQTLIRNGLAYDMARNLGMAFAPMVEYVDVYLNGVYQGNYLLTDQIEVTNDRVDIEENTTDIDTGYLIEYDMKVYELGVDVTDDNFFIVDGIPFVLKSPDIDDEHYSNEQYQFIRDYMINLFDVLKNRRSYEGWIDEASFIDWFIVNEVFKNVDSGYSSIYYYKDKSGVLKMGPVWDFDLSSGNYGHLQEDMRGPEGWYTNLSFKNIIFYYLMQYDGFKAALKERWNDVYEDVILGVIDDVYPMADSISKSRYENFETWQIIGTYEDWFISPEILALDTYQKQLYFLREFLIVRIDWLNREINQF